LIAHPKPVKKKKKKGRRKKVTLILFETRNRYRKAGKKRKRIRKELIHLVKQMPKALIVGSPTPSVAKTINSSFSVRRR
jgi:hypothetical protein